MPKPSLPVRLALLIAGTTLPLIIYATVLVFNDYEQDRKDATERVLETVRSIRLVLDAEIGVYTHEKGVTQRARFSVDVEVTPPEQAVEDQIWRVLDYYMIIAIIKGILAEGHINLVETLADEMATRCLSHPRAASVKVKIEKLDKEPGAVRTPCVDTARRPVLERERWQSRLREIGAESVCGQHHRDVRRFRGSPPGPLPPPGYFSRRLSTAQKTKPAPKGGLV